ncbi:PIN domain-containing protein [Capnocytophaga catalasegens]|uniref:Ribonuclease VapC n=1 Tax=Capnocytophaga catalasegens TaxID=1004260 RepID=A0AAV5AWR4_9FLAO|nr:PIN domain-containing protein [Capnocytophaga catalasegens]GIZ15063.1 hypothetical protein RCZ03_10630 [Capnocytophaga catalasegens]GJM49443.1 hypothetical protein RCZ15_04180 [Capnocytophaga catalasegens]GJM52593.1 hypothetical protein RCZ16_09100 [Capnocytophaga catalasegens]
MQAIKIICDTNIISNYLGEKGDIKVKQEVLKIGIENIVITSVVYMELIRWLSSYKGFSKSERIKCKNFFDSLKVLHLNKEISVRAMEISKKIDSIDAPDVLIATTAIYNKLPLYTLNVKHFERIKGVKLHIS